MSDTSSHASSVEAPPSFPSGLSNAFWFATFNALSYQMILGSPMVLFAKSLGASATVLGVIAGMMPLLVILQIPAANHIDRIGFKKFVFAGWGARVSLIFVMALVPVLGFFLDGTAQLALIIFLLFGFNASRGISSAAWLPWITSLVPTGLRGKYLTREAVCVNLASCVTLELAAWCLSLGKGGWRFAVLFGFSALNGAVSLRFLKRIPDAPVPEKPRTSNTPVPWLELARHEPFRKLLRMQFAWALAYGGINAFTAAYLKSSAGMSEAAVLFLTGLAFLGGLAGLLLFETHTDTFGSKPVVSLCLFFWLVIMAGWVCMAARVFEPGIGVVLAIELAMGFAYAVVNMNNTRLAMVLAPTMGRNHFFALYSVVQNVVLGIAPILWGIMIDGFGSRLVVWHGLELNRFGFFFLAVMVCFGVTWHLTQKIEEPKAREMDELLKELIVQSPVRGWVRLWWR